MSGGKFDLDLSASEIVGTNMIFRRIGISLRKGYLNGGIESVRAIVRIIRENGFEPVFVNHSFHPNDPETDDSRFVADVAREEGVALTASLDESFSAYRGLSGMVAMRLHSGLLAFVGGVPCLLLSYSEKTDAFARRTQAPWCLIAGEFSAETFQKSFAEFAERLRTPAFFALPEKCGKIVSETRISYEQTFYGLESDHGEGQRPEGPSPG
jgi:hypothetical protein